MALQLTFDDGPSPTWTPRVLDALRDTGARATFFVLGEEVLRHPALVERTTGEGHRVELHAHRHLRHDRLTRDEIRDDARRGIDALGRTGVAPRWWRTPWGRITDDTRAVAGELGLTLVGWDADTHDWRGDPAARMLDVLRRDVPDGGVVLAHDGLGPGATREGCAGTVDLIGLAATWAAARGLRLEALPDPEDAPDGAPAAPDAGAAVR